MAERPEDLRDARGRRAATVHRRATILAAALDLFDTHGIVATTMDEIRVRAGVSVGSLYHHFASKDAVAAALYVESIARYQREAAIAVTDDLGPRQWIRAAIGHHARWSVENPAAARFLLAHRGPEVRAATASEVAELNAGLELRVGDWLSKHVRAGRLRSIRPDVFIAVVIGPIHQLVRRWAFRPSATPPTEMIDALTDAAWRAVRATPAAATRARRERPEPAARR